ncbi:hypothetical protein HWV62_11562 [Athelia sp. TMB]|nr:hypothetical protein HWV62_11562 [Athelia sp. TMB]
MSFWEDNERLREDNRTLREDNEALWRERDHLHRQLVGGNNVELEYGDKQQRIDRTRGTKVEKLESLEDNSRILRDDLATNESDVQPKRAQKHRLEVYVEIPSYKRHRQFARRASLTTEVPSNHNAQMGSTVGPDQDPRRSPANNGLTLQPRKSHFRHLANDEIDSEAEMNYTEYPDIWKRFAHCLDGISDFTIYPAPLLATVSRQFLRTEYEASMDLSMTRIPSAKNPSFCQPARDRDVLFVPSSKFPGIPSFPGARGFTICQSKRLFQNRWDIFACRNGNECLYLGQYIFCMKETFRGQEVHQWEHIVFEDINNDWDDEFHAAALKCIAYDHFLAQDIFLRGSRES